MPLRTGMFHLASWLLYFRLNRPTSMFITKRNVFVSPLYHTMKIEVVVGFLHGRQNLFESAQPSKCLLTTQYCNQGFYFFQVFAIKHKKYIGHA